MFGNRVHLRTVHAAGYIAYQRHRAGIAFLCFPGRQLRVDVPGRQARNGGKVATHAHAARPVTLDTGGDVSIPDAPVGPPRHPTVGGRGGVARGTSFLAVEAWPKHTTGKTSWRAQECSIEKKN